MLNNFFWVAVSKNMFFSKSEQFISLSDLDAPCGGRGHWKDLAVFRWKRFWSRKKIKKHVENLVFCCRFKKYVFVKNGRIFFSFLALGAPRGRPRGRPIGAVHTENTQPFSGQKNSDLQKHVENLLFIAVSKCVFVENGAIFAIFPPFALGAPF